MPTSEQTTEPNMPTVTPNTTQDVVVEQPTPQTPVNSDVIKLVEHARAEEKTKLYGQIESLKEQLKARMNPDERLAEELSSLKQKFQETQTVLTTVQQKAVEDAARWQAELRRRDLQAYLERRLREETGKGTEFFIEMVKGASEQEIEASFEASKAAFAQQKAFFYNQFMASQPTPPPSPVVSATPAVSVSVAPSAFPTAPNAVPAQQPNPADLNGVISSLTTPEAIRSGDFAKSRAAIHATLRSQPAPRIDGNVPFANMPRQYVVDAVQQPPGLPTPPVQNPRVQTVPSQPLPVPDNVHTSGPVNLPNPNLVDGNFDANAARNAAIAAAKHRMQIAGVQGDVTGSHPMIRNH